MSKDDFECAEIEDREERCPIKGRMVLCSKWLMYWGSKPIPVRLTFTEADRILQLSDNGSFTSSAASITTAGKIKAALQREGQEGTIAIDCHEDEVQFVERSKLA